MAFDVFGLRDRVVGEYRDYVESFVHVRDPRVNDYVRTMLGGGELWPDAVLQLNPAYESSETLGELADKYVIAADSARYFGRDIRLHRHQREAIEAARASDHYVVSTGTGSGKSLAYLVPIVDHVLKNRPEDHSVRAIIVYPMNALINSQLAALQAFAKNWPGCPLTFGRYTGQDRGKDRDSILTDPPHILLTNYVMLEYMLIRSTDRALIHQTTRALKFLAVDELHVYRGRQGADVAMLMRRVRQRAGRDDLLCIGTSATLVSGEIRSDSRGRWRSNDDTDDEPEADGRRGSLLAGLKPYVTDSRNLLLLRPTAAPLDEVFLNSLAFALRRAIQIEYQVEEQEVAVELIGHEEHLSLLFWEAAEGGIGVWERLVAEPREFHRVARRALQLLHFDAESGAPVPEWEKRCTAACYDCLLSYSNQPFHRHLNRHSVREFLLILSRAGVAPSANSATYDAAYARLLGLLDPASSFEQSFLDFLYRNRLRLPDHAQHAPARDIAVQPDFYYERNGVPGVCVFVDGPHHTEHTTSLRDRSLREALKDQGFRVVGIASSRPLAEQIAENADVFRTA
jgi:hypothetical protein